MSATAETGQPELEAKVETACTICGNPEHRLIASAEELEAQRRYLRLFHRRRLRRKHRDSLKERADFTQDYATNIVACTRCGLVFRDPRPTDDAITKAYENDTYGPELLRALFESQVALFRPKVRLLRRWVTGKDPVVFEIGSFVGGFLAASAEHGWQAVGIDPGAEAADFCESRGLTVLRESVDRCEFPRSAADCVAIWNTFDQLPRPHVALRAAQHCLRDEGVLAVRVPNGRCFEVCTQRLTSWPAPLRRVLLAAMAWNNLLSFPYLHGYSGDTLDRLAAQYGFRRIHEQEDVLTQLSDEKTLRWAAAEERLLKAVWKGAARIAAMFGAGRREPAPWLDVYYRKQR